MDQNTKIGLVLSGGGTKGAYQAGVYKAMEELGLIPHIKAIAGTSIGSFNALLFSCGTVDPFALWKTLRFLRFCSMWIPSPLWPICSTK